MRRRGVRYAELTSLLDVLFILVFASLVQAAALVKKAREPAASPPPARAATSPTLPRPGLPPSRAAVRRQAAARLLDLLRKRGIIYVRVSAAGVLTAVEVEDEGGRVRAQRLRIPLVQRVADRDVGLVYLGDRNAGLRICSLVRLNLGRQDLAQHLVVVVPELPWERLRYALVEGMLRDQDRCFADEKGTAVVVDPRRPPGKERP